MRDERILVVGAGGLGCELVKDLISLGCEHLDILDMDLVEHSNLNRQLFYRPEDVGNAKALVLMNHLRREYPHLQNINGHHCDLKERSLNFYELFDVILAGLDSVEARRFLNSLVIECVRTRKKKIIFIDCGTEEYQGHVRIIAPFKDPCIECTFSFYPQQKKYPLCTPTSMFSRPEHCIEYARSIRFPKMFRGAEASAENKEDLKIIQEIANEYSKENGLDTISYEDVKLFMQDVVISAATTNSIVAAIAVNELYKYFTGHILSWNYYFYNGRVGVYLQPHNILRLNNCIICGSSIMGIEVEETILLRRFLDVIEHKYNIRDISARCIVKTLYMHGPASLQQATAPNLEKCLKELLSETTLVYITSSSINFYLNVLYV